MSVTIKSVAAYLGKSASTMLSDAPFKGWEFDRAVDSDLDEPVIDYVFADHGLDFVCDQNDDVATIFFHSDEHRCFDEGFIDLPLSSNRRTVIDFLGPPAKSGEGIIDPVLGDFGPWDRFLQLGYAIHIEYRVGVDRIKKLTLMRNDMVP